MKPRASGPCSALMAVNFSLMRSRASSQVISTKVSPCAHERLGEAIGGVDEVPGELALDAGGDAVGGTVHGLDLEDVAVAGPDVEGAADAAVGADGLGALDALVAHFGFHLGQGEDGAVAGVGLDAFDDLDHVVEDLGGEVGEVAGVAEHGFFHERVAGADGDAVAAGDAA